MEGRTIYQDEYICISSKPDGIYLESFKKGLSFERLNNILAKHHEIDITNFPALKNVLSSAPKPPEKIGKLKERIQISIVDNGLKAYITFNLSLEELDLDNREKLILETQKKIMELGIHVGIKTDLFKGELVSGKSYLVAEGTPAVNGSDAILRMYQLENSTPITRQDGKVDFYELRLINRVRAGDWLGDMTAATEGTAGQSVTGSPILPVKGKSRSLSYDKNTVYEITEGNVTTLYSRINGAVNYVDNKITISNHLEIDGDVDFKTGNIKFDGYITIRGTVADGFIVEATKDVEINGDMGIGNVKSITSTGGSIFIKGGIASRNRSEIKAAKSVYTKFIDNVNVFCGETAHIGFYCINSTITAREVVVEASNGHIIGGCIKAEIKVTVPILGSAMEKKTTVEVEGFNRQSLTDELDHVYQRLTELKDEQQRVKLQLSRIGNKNPLSPVERKEYDSLLDKLSLTRDEVRALDEKRKTITGYLKTKGDCEISVTRKIYPNCFLILSKNVVEITSSSPPATYYIQDGELKQA